MKGPDTLAILVIAGLIVAGVSTVLTFGVETRWIGHAVTGIIGMLLLVAVILTGAVQKGRIRTIRFHTFSRHHKTASVWFSLFVIGTFGLGLLTTMGHGEQVLESPHGIVGLILVLLALAQLMPSLLITKRAGIRAVHMIVGYTIVPVFILQTTLGFSAAWILVYPAG